MEATKQIRPRILVVDDDAENLMILEAILSDHYSLKLMNDSSEVLEYAIANPPDLILLDVMMPKIDGFELCRKIKANRELYSVPVIFLTSKNDVESEERGFSVGASDFIHKPISAPIVNARVKTHIKIKLMLELLRNENAHLQENAEQWSEELARLQEFVWGSQLPKY